MSMSVVRSRHGNSDKEAGEALWMQRKKNRYYRDVGTSPRPSTERLTTLIWRPPQPLQQPRDKKMMDRKVDVVYYLSRNGLLEQPHFMEVTLPSPAVDGLHLRDVIARLNSLRGRSFSHMYSWSSKRNYKGGYVWQDLSEDDLIHPCNDTQEYVLKGSQLLRLPSSQSEEATSYPTSNESPCRIPNNLHGSAYEARSTPEFVRNSTDASTQTDDDKRRMLPSSFAEELKKAEAVSSLSPPPGSISSNEEGLEDGIKRREYDNGGRNQGGNEGRRGSDIRNQVYEGERASGRMKAASSALMHLIMCVPKSPVDGVDVDNINNVLV